ncbi:MAG: hypothetical protein KGR46_12015 [Verrucomicrobia bacterium]|nr:hypothetical protein [Verrucomicrobiota bacterium]
MSARTHNDGGPAFPRNITVFGHQNKIDADTGTGMSLRDWFAGQALVSLSRKDFHLFGAGGDELNAEIAAQNCYEIADAMLAERNRKEAK